MVNGLIVCIRSRDIDTGNWILRHVCKAGDNLFMVTSNTNIILEMYAKCGSLNIARDLFNKMPKRNIFGWKCYLGEY